MGQDFDVCVLVVSLCHANMELGKLQQVVQGLRLLMAMVRMKPPWTGVLYLNGQVLELYV